MKGRRERKRSWWRGEREREGAGEGEFSEARGHVNLGKM